MQSSTVIFQGKLHTRIDQKDEGNLVYTERSAFGTYLTFLSVCYSHQWMEDNSIPVIYKNMFMDSNGTSNIT